MLLKWFHALSMGGMTAVLLMLLNTQSPAKNALEEESQIFNADNASSFGEDPDPLRYLQLLAIARDELGQFAQLSLDGRQRHQRAGELIFSCVALVDILDDAVLIDNCGSYAMLASAEFGLALKGEQFPSSDLPSVNIIDLRQNLAVTKLIGDYRQRLYARPLSLRGAVNVEVQVDSLDERRYYLSPGKDAALFTVLPLRAGDRVVAVNGHNLADTEALTDIYAMLADLKQLALTLEREDQRWVLLLKF